MLKSISGGVLPIFPQALITSNNKNKPRKLKSIAVVPDNDG
jgi:hypothetical protein